MIKLHLIVLNEVHHMLVHLSGDRMDAMEILRRCGKLFLKAGWDLLA